MTAKGHTVTVHTVTETVTVSNDSSGRFQRRKHPLGLSRHMELAINRPRTRVPATRPSP